MTPEAVGIALLAYGLGAGALGLLVGLVASNLNHTPGHGDFEREELVEKARQRHPSSRVTCPDTVPNEWLL